ncbi:NEW3 domain-containing protein [Streptomyces zhihengii]
MTISPVDLQGPAISAVDVTVKNTAPERLRSLKVSFAGPVGWAVQPAERSVDGSLAQGQSATAQFRIQVPEARAGFRIRTFTATATYRGGDGAGSATGTRSQRTGSRSRTSRPPTTPSRSPTRATRRRATTTARATASPPRSSPTPG